MVKNVEGLLRIVAPLHVDPDEALMLTRPLQDVLNVGDAKLFGHVESHRRELQRYVGVELLLLDAIEHLDILPRCFVSFAFVPNAFSKQIERGGNAFRVQSLDRVERGFERLAGNETAGETLCHAVVADEAEYSWLIGEVEQCVAEHRCLRASESRAVNPSTL